MVKSQSVVRTKYYNIVLYKMNECRSALVFCFSFFTFMCLHVLDLKGRDLAPAPGLGHEGPMFPSIYLLMVHLIWLYSWLMVGCDRINHTDGNTDLSTICILHFAFSFLFSLKKHHIFTADLFFYVLFLFSILSGLGSGDEMVKWLNTNLPIISPWL